MIVWLPKLVGYFTCSIRFFLPPLVFFTNCNPEECFDGEEHRQRQKDIFLEYSFDLLRFAQYCRICCRAMRAVLVQTTRLAIHRLRY